MSAAAAQISFSMPTAQPSLHERLIALNFQIETARARVREDRIRLANSRMQLNIRLTHRSRLLTQADRQFLGELTDQSLEIALSQPGPLVEKLATGLQIAQDEDGDDDVTQCPRCEGSGIYQRMPTDEVKPCSICNGTGKIGPDGLAAGETPAPQAEPTIESDGDFADRIVAEATAERNEALSEYAQALRKQEEEAAMNAINGDEMCDSSGEA